MKNLEKRKIIIMYDFYSESGGVERIMLFQARALKKAGYDVVFAFAYADNKLVREKLKDFPVVEYSKLPVKNETLQISLSILNADLEKFKNADLIICHSFPASWTALKIKNRFNVPYILHLHHPPQFLYNVKADWAGSTLKRKVAYIGGKFFKKILRKMDRICVENADGHIIECKSVQRIIKNVYNIDGKISYPTFNNNFNIKKIRKKELLKYSIFKNFILASGRIIRQKRFDYLIKAFAGLKNPDLQLVLAGKYDEKEKKDLEDLAKRYQKKILFLGALDLEELIKLYNLAELTVLTCPKEWFGIVPIESMACGTPVVAWKDNMGPEESVIEGTNGFLAKPYDVNDLALKIENALNKKWNKKKIRNSIKKFSEANVEKEFLKIIDGLSHR